MKQFSYSDLRSSNILLTKTGDVKLGDVGLSEAMIKTIHTNAFQNKMPYTSPELAEFIMNNSGIFSYKTDVW